MERLQALSAIARGSSLVLCLIWTLTSQAASTSLSGVVTDSLGHALAGAEVLVLAEHLPLAPLASAQTNAEGRYSISELAPGVYRVAALKQGYLAYLGRIDTLLRTSMDFVLRPAPATADGSTAPEDAAWVLRVPDRSILRDTEARDLMRAEGRGGAPSPSASRFYETIQGEFDHMMALGGMLADAELGSTAVAGADTSMRLSSTVGERTSVRIQGHRESLASDEERDEESTGLDGSSMLVDVSYDTGSDSRLETRAYYGTRSVTFDTPDPSGELASVRQGQRSWGYDAAWSKQIDSASRMAFQAGYLEASLEDGIVRPVGTEDLSEAAATRVAGAQGLFETVLGDGHHVRLVARTERAFTSQDPPIDLGTGWTARFRAEDTWNAFGPVSLVYGMAVDHGFDPGSPALVVPHAGYTLTANGLSLRMVLSYRVFRDGSEAREETDPLGYDIELEAPLSHGTFIRGSLQRVPDAGPGMGARDTAAWTSGSLLPVLDGGAGSHRARISVERHAASLRMTLLFSTGTAEGLSAQLVPLDAPFRIESEPSLRYSTGGIGVRVLPTGTDLAAEYVRVQDGSTRIGDSEIAPLEEYVELRVAQDLLRLPSWGGTCRLLVAARTTPRQDEDEGPDSARTLAALDHRLSAGLSVAF